MPVLHIDNAAMVAHAERLQRIHKSALPVVIRQTLNKAAFDTKTVTMPASADRFIHRKPTFFKANSAVEVATGFDINTMRSIIGFMPKPGDRSHAVEDLQAQEHGGGIRNRSFIAMAQARKSGRWDKMQRNEAIMQRVLNHVIDSSKMQGANEKIRFTKACIKAGVGGFVLGNKITSKGNKILYIVQSINRFGGNNVALAMPLFAVKKDRVVSPKPTHFMETASIQSAKKMEAYFTELANLRIARV